MNRKTNKQLKLAAALLLIGVSAMPLSAKELDYQASVVTISQPSNAWQHIKTENGLSISYATIEINGERFLSIRFENTTANQVDVTWTLNHNQQQVVITEDEMLEARVSLAPAETLMVDGTHLIPMNPSDEMSDFTVSIQPTKR